MTVDRLRWPFIALHLTLGVVVLVGSAPTALAAQLSPNGNLGEPKSGSLTTDEIFMKVATTYAACRSYRESGIVKTVFIEAGGRRIDEKPFKTAFGRPDRFRFEFAARAVARNREYRYIVWRKGNEVLTWWDVTPGVEKPASLGVALAGATGVSGGSAHVIPALLLPEEVRGRCLTDMTGAIRIEDAQLDGVQCLRIQGTYANWPITLWIEKKSFLVRRIDTLHDFGTFRTESITTYDPVLDGDVTDAMLEFDPPRRQ